MRAILTFHSIDDSGSVVSYDPQLFDELLTAIRKKAIPIVSLAELLEDKARSGIAITFDDGMQSVHQNALPILQKHGATAHVFLTTDVIDSEDLWPPQPAGIPSFRMLGWEEVEDLHRAGVFIECHTHTHPDMRTLDAGQVIEECETADKLITERLGRKPAFFAYPFGYHNSATRDLARARYAGSVTTELRSLGRVEDSAALPRLDTYYLRSRAAVTSIDSALLHGYLWVRNHMRTLRGSQCTAQAD